MSRMKVMTIVGTRPEVIRLSRVIAALEKYTDHTLVHTGQNYDYELNQIFFEELRLPKPQHFLEAASETAAGTIAQVIAKADIVLAERAPEALLVLGDTNSCLAAIAAKRRKIPIFHMEAGNRCHDERVPEEINRRIIDHISDINLPYSSLARENLLREGLPSDRTIKTGSPMFEVLTHYGAEIAAARALGRLQLEAGKYFLVSVHREENVDSQEQWPKLFAMLNDVAERFRQRVIVSTHPRTRRRIEAVGPSLRGEIELLKPLGFFDYVSLQQQARAVLSDSGTVTEESSILGFSAINLRETHERPEGMEEAAVMMAGLKSERVLQCLEVLESQRASGAQPSPIVSDYRVPNVSEKVVRIIQSYTDYVNQNVWRRWDVRSGGQRLDGGKGV